MILSFTLALTKSPLDILNKTIYTTFDTIRRSSVKEKKKKKDWSSPISKLKTHFYRNSDALMDTIKPATFNTSLTLKKQTKKVNLLQVKNPSSPKKKKKKGIRKTGIPWTIRRIIIYSLVRSISHATSIARSRYY